MRIGIVGDTHGNVQDITNVLNEMGTRKITHVFVVGDFGLWTHEAAGHEFLDTVNAVAEGNKLSVFAIGGNHENWDHWNWFVENMPTAKGFALVRRRVLLAPKVHEFSLAKKRFVVAGGAVSIDRDYRMSSERNDPRHYERYMSMPRGRGPRTEYWPNETLSDADMEKVKRMRFPEGVDVLLTHDCSNYTHFNGRLKPDAASQDHRHKIDDVIKHVKPMVHFHGHMHTRYEWENSLSHGDSAFLNEPWTGPVTRTYGLEANPQAQRWSGGTHTGDWWGILETDDLSFAFQGKGMQFRSLDADE